MTRAQAFALSSTLSATFAATTWACGVYGGPPPRAGDDREAHLVDFDAPISGEPAPYLEALVVKANKEGCLAQVEGDHAKVTCGPTTIHVTAKKTSAHVECQEMSKNDCRGIYARVAP